MLPAFTDKERIVIDPLAKGFNRDDVIVFKYPKDPSQYFVKRIIGLPGEQVEIKENSVFINGQKYNDSQYTNGKPTLGAKGVITLAADEYFVLGDNRTASSDSRIWGPLKKDLIVGKYVKKIVNQ